MKSIIIQKRFFILVFLKIIPKIFLFENNSLKFEQDFKFGTNIIIKDISQVTSLSIDTVIYIFKKIRFNEDIAEDELIDKDFF